MWAFRAFWTIAVVLLARFAYWFGWKGLADNACKKSISRGSQFDVSIVQGIADIYERNGDYDSAISCYEWIKGALPGDYSPYWQLGMIYEDRGKVELSLEHYKKAYELFEDKASDFAGAVYSKIRNLS